MCKYFKRCVSLLCVLSFLIQMAVMPYVTAESYETAFPLKGWSAALDYAENGFLQAKIARGIAYSGEQSFYVSSAPTDGGNQWGSLIPLEIADIDVTKAHTLTFYAKGAITGLSVRMTGSSDYALSASSAASAEDAEKTKEGWMKYSASLPAGGSDFKLIVKGTFTVYLDDISLKEDGGTVNLIPHGDFEGKVVYLDADGWTPTKEGTFENAWDVKTAVGIAYRGARSLYIEYERAADSDGNSLAGTNWLNVICDAAPAVESGKTYQLSFYGKSQSGNLYSSLGDTVQGISWAEGISPENTVKEAEGWKKYSVEITAPQDGAQLGFRAQWTTGSWYIDDIVLTECGGTENLITGGDFEEKTLTYRDLTSWSAVQGGTGCEDAKYTAVLSLDTAYSGKESLSLDYSARLNKDWAFNTDTHTADAEITKAAAFEGEHSLYVNNLNASSWSALKYSGGLDLEAGEDYTLTFYAKILSNRVRMLLGGAIVMTNELTPQDTEVDGWKKYTATINAANTSKLYFDFQNWIKCEYYIDDITVTKKNDDGTDTVIMKEDFETGTETSLWIKNIAGNTLDSVKAYTLSFYAKGDITGLYAQTADNIEKAFSALDAQTPENAAKAAEGWKKYFYTFPSGGTDFHFVIKGVPAFSAYLDKVSLMEQGTGIDLIQSGDFEFIEDAYPGIKAGLNDKISELEALIAQCESQGMPLDYEKANHAILCRFVELMDNEAANGDYSRMEEYERQLTEIFEETKDALKGYLAGTKTPVRVPKYVTSELTLDGTSVRATTFDGEKTEERPVFFVGFGPWEAASADIPFISEIGGNIIQTDVMASLAIVPKRPINWIYSSYCLYGTPSALAQEVTEEQVSGSYSLKFTRPQNSSTCYAYIAQDIPVKPNTTYTYGLKAKGKGISTNAAFFHFGGERTNIIDSVVPADWTAYDRSYTTGAEETSLRLMVRAENYIEDAVYVDDIYVKESGSDINLVQNGDFETFMDANASAIDQEAAELGISFDETYLDNLRTTLKTAEENNVMVSVAVSPHFIPDFYYEKFPDITRTGTDFNFLDFPLNREDLNKMFSVWARKVASIASEYQSVSDLLLTNEPQLFAASESWYIPDWQAFLKERYGTIDALNETYQSSYMKFEDVIMPTAYEATPLFQDYKDFNAMMHTQFHQTLRDAVKTEYPELKVNSKVMNYINYSFRLKNQWVRNGNNYELMAEMMDLNGCDPGAFPVAPYEGHGTTYLKMAWYDYMTSLAEKPVWNTENHVLADEAPEIVQYDEVNPRHVATDVWNSAVHGTGGDVIWLWDLRQGDMPWVSPRYANTNFVHRPESVAEISKTALDLNRLSKEVTALQKAERKVGILYSKSSTTFGADSYIETMVNAYADTIGSGQKVTFVVDTMPENMNDCELLIVPNATHVKENMLHAIEAYLDGGGKVLLMGTDALKYNEYNQGHNTNTLSSIRNHSNTDTASTVREKISAMELSEITLVDANTGLAVDDVEWMYTDYDGKILVHVVNHNAEQSVSLKVLHKGTEISALSDLRKCQEITGAITLQPCDTVLLAFDAVALSLVDETGAVLEENLTELKSGIITCRSAVEGTMILALYKDDELVRAVWDGDTIAVTMDTPGHYRLMATVWNGNTLDALVESKNITMEVTQ